MRLSEIASTLAPIASSEYDYISTLDTYTFEDHRARARSRVGTFPSLENIYLACINEAYAIVRQKEPKIDVFEKYIDLAVLAGHMHGVSRDV